MTVLVQSFTIYHSPNAYLGTVLLRRALAAVPGANLLRRPFFVPRKRGVLVAEMLGGRENQNIGSYYREDCRRWADRHGIPFCYPAPEVFRERAARGTRSPWHREELPARAYYAAEASARGARRGNVHCGVGRRTRRERPRDDLLGGDTCRLGRKIATRPGRGGRSLRGGKGCSGRLRYPRLPGRADRRSRGERFFGKDRIEWIVEACKSTGQ